MTGHASRPGSEGEGKSSEASKGGAENADKSHESENNVPVPTGEHEVASGPETERDKAGPPPTPAEVQELLKGLPPEQRQIIERTFSTFLQVPGPMFNPVLRKINPDHITKILDGADRDNQREWEDRGHVRKHHVVLSLIVLVGFLAASSLFLFADQVELLTQVIALAVAFAGGWGVGRAQRKDHSSE